MGEAIAIAILHVVPTTVLTATATAI
jgi:hypothetical protein